MYLYMYTCVALYLLVNKLLSYPILTPITANSKLYVFKVRDSKIALNLSISYFVIPI